MKESKYGKYIVTELKTPNFSTEFVEAYAKFATRILWMDNSVVEGAFQMNCSWYLNASCSSSISPMMVSYTYLTSSYIFKAASGA